MTPLRFTGMLLCLGLTAPAVGAQTLSFDRDDVASTAGARGIATADFNRDGWTDMVTAHHDPDGITVHLNQGAAGGYSATFIDLPGGPFDVVTGDLNKDGIPDIAVANPDANVINVLYGRAAGGFSGPMNVGARFNPRSLAIADMDKDGNPDIVFTEYYNRGVAIYWGDGAQSFTHRQPGLLNAGDNPQGVAAADFNVDGWPDLVVASSGSAGLTIHYHTPGVNTFSRLDLPVPPQQNVVAVGDFDQDGRPDIAAASTNTSDITVVLNRRAGFSTHVFPSGGGSPRGIVTADVNRDGSLDLITGNRATSTIQLALGRGDGTFADPVGHAAGGGSRAVAAGDFNNDGRVDLASANEYAATATVLTNTTDFPRAGFGFRRQVLGPGEGYGVGGDSVGVADFDRDGRLDAAVNGNGLHVLLADGRTSRPAAFGIEEVAAANVNGDGYADIIAVSAGSSTNQPSRIETFIGDGTGNFPGRLATTTDLIAYAMETADFNLDGRVDVIITGRGVSGDYSRTQIFMGNGDGTFAMASSIDSSEWPFALMVGDVDRDGDPDVVTTGHARPSNEAVVVTRLNEGAWHFGAPRATVVPNLAGISYGALGDVNHDGFLDFVGAGSARDWRSKERLVVLLGGPTGFASPSYLTTTQAGLGVSIGDLTHDGHLDVMTDDGVFFKGHGDGTFGTEELFDFYAPGSRIVDVNRDGLADLVGSFALASVQFILNQPGTNNGAPTVDLGPDFTMEYREFFGEGEGRELWARASDPDLHKMTYKWHLPDGRIEDSSTFPFWGVPFAEPGSYEITVEANDGRGAVGSDTVAYTVTPEKEVVLHVGNAPWYTEPVGNWQIAADATAASGKTGRDVNLGAPKITSPSPNPSSYLDIGFVADTTQTYKLWVRLKADGNSWSNDSLWLQFTNAVDSSGRSIAPGTASGIEVNLEECSGCGVSGWGWRDEAWGQRDVIGTLTIRFTKSGWQHVRIQTREDGASVDQIVLSSATYRTMRPGAVKNDATILTPRAYW
jgi:hypothetical protein